MKIQLKIVRLAKKKLNVSNLRFGNRWTDENSIDIPAHNGNFWWLDESETDKEKKSIEICSFK